MEFAQLTGSLFRMMIYSAANNLENNKVEVNELNVFPVPDGDTGTNMGLTMLAAAKEVQQNTDERLHVLGEAAARGALMGARGNSGVILSQFFRGLSLGLEGLTEASPKQVAEAVKMSSETAYKAVIKPVEGTMLTVGRFAAEAALNASKKNVSLLDVLEATLRGAKEGLEKTPTMLPVLREAGVVDAGGYGIVVALEGAVKSFRKNKPIELVKPEDREDETEPKFETRIGAGITHKEDIEFKYCTEFIVRGTNIQIPNLREKLEVLGDSLLVVGSGDTVKVHVHTNTPGEALNICGRLGDLLRININNMVEQNIEASAKVEKEHHEEVPAREMAVVAVCVGQGLTEIFRSLGADEVVTGGQTMNPSTEDLVNAVKKTNANNVILLPNNKNIIFSADQVKHLTEQNVVVIPTKTIPQGIGALMSYSPEEAPEELSEQMLSSAKAVRTGEVTYAVRSTTASGLQINERDIIGLNEGEIKSAGKDLDDVVIDLVGQMVDEDSEIITLYYGEEMSESQAQQTSELLNEKLPDLEVEVYYGGQPLYYYVIAVE